MEMTIDEMRQEYGNCTCQEKHCVMIRTLLAALDAAEAELYAVEEALGTRIEELEQQHALMLEALEWYAKPSHYLKRADGTSAVERDEGQRARDALAKVKGEAEGGQSD